MKATKFKSVDGNVTPSVHLGLKAHKGKYFLLLLLGMIEPGQYTKKEFEERMKAAGWVREKAKKKAKKKVRRSAAPKSKAKLEE